MPVMTGVGGGLRVEPAMTQRRGMGIAGRARNDERVTKEVMVYMLQYNWI